MVTLQLILYTGIALIAVPVVMMSVLSLYVTYSFLQDDEMSAGIFKIGVVIVVIGAVLVALRYILEWLGIGVV